MNVPSTSKQVVQDEDFFEDSALLANFDNSSFRDNSRLSESNINDSANRSGLNVSALCCDEEISGYDKLAGRTWIYPTNYPVRDYQFNIIKAAILNNTLVSLPTGLGKTFIAAVIMYNFYRWYPLGKIVFTAPTRPLVAQQINACYHIIGIPPQDTIEMTGHMQASTRKSHWQSKRVFFATPQVIYNDIKSGICPAEKIRCLVIDEAHRARGNYAYCQIVGTLTDMGSKTYRVLALSATPGSRVEDVVNVVKNLHISHLELRTESSIDVAPYSHVRKINTVIVNLGDELTQLRQQFGEIIDDYARRLKQLHILPHNLGNMSKGRVVMLYKEYQTKDRSARHPQHSQLMRDFIHLIALFHGLELLVRHGSRVFLNYFDEHPEKTWIQADDRLTALLERLRDDLGVNPMTINTSVLPDGSIPEVPRDLTFGHPKFDKLKQIILNHFTEAQEMNKDTRAIVFCEYRESVNLVNCLLLQFRPLIAPQMFIGQGATGKDGKAAISQKQQLRVMNEFREGTCNTLIATCVAEEGLDVGSVDLIVCFDISTRSPIRLVQRCGRTGRERGGQVHILVTEGREHQILLDCMRQRDGLNKKIHNSQDVKAALFATNPRLIPRDFMPKCQKMHITVAVAKKDGNKGKKNNKDLRTMLLGRGSSSSSSTSNKDLEAAIITEEEFIQVFPEGLPSLPAAEPLELWARSKESIKELSKSEDSGVSKLSTWLEWQRTPQTTVNVGHSKDTEILTSLLQYCDAKRLEMLPPMQNPSFPTQDFSSQKFLRSPSKVTSPAKVISPSKAKPPRKKLKPLAKSPGKKDGDIRAMFSTATKSTKSYTKVINDLGIQNDGSIPTRLFDLLVDLRLENINVIKKCYICENICDCTIFKDLKNGIQEAKIQSLIEESSLPDLDLIDEIDAKTILKCIKIDKTLDSSNIEDRNMSYIEVNNRKSNFELEFDFGSPIDLMSPERNENEIKLENYEVKVKEEVNFDIGDIEDVFADSSPDEVIANEGNDVKTEANDGNNEITEPKQALGFFGLDSVDDIFAESDDDDDLIQNSPKTPDKSTKKEKRDVQTHSHGTKIEDHKENHERIDSIQNQMDTKTEQLSPSLLSGKIKLSTSPILCTQVRKFKLSTKKKQPQSSTPVTNNVRRQLIPDLSNNNNTITQKDTTKYSIQSNPGDITNKSMFSITQLIDMINRTDPNVRKEITILDNDSRSTSPILLTQADKKKVIENKYNASKYPVEKTEKQKMRSKSISNKVPIESTSKDNSKNRTSLIILESDESDSDNDNTQLYDINDASEVVFNNNLNDTPIKLNSSKINLKIDNFDDVPNVSTPFQSPLSNKRKLETDDDVAASPYFNKKPKLDTDTKKKVTTQEKILAALNKKDDKFNNDMNINYVLSPKKVISQKENEIPFPFSEKDKKSEEEIIIDVRKNNLEKLQRFRRDTKPLSLKNKLNTVLNRTRIEKTHENTVLNTQRTEKTQERSVLNAQRTEKTHNDNILNTPKTEKTHKRKLTFDESDDEFDVSSNRHPVVKSCRKVGKNHKVRNKRKPNEFLDLEAALSDTDASADELTDDSAGSLEDFICDQSLTQREDMRAVYMRSVKSPVKGVFKIPELPKKFNKEDILSQYVEEDSYQMDSFCVDSHIGLTQVNEFSELDLAEMLLEERKLKKLKKCKVQKPCDQDIDQNNDDSPVVRKRRIVNRIHSDSDDSS